MRGTDACWSVHIYAVAGSESLRDVIAFPKSASGKELMSGAPAAATDEQLEEFHIASTGRTARAAEQQAEQE